jgi:hypothetical protein
MLLAAPAADQVHRQRQRTCHPDCRRAAHHHVLR